MLDFTDALNVNFVASYAGKIYSQPRDPSNVAYNGDAIDKLNTDTTSFVIQNAISTGITARRQLAANAASAISTVQKFDAAAATISGKLTRMAELAEESAAGSYTYTDTEKTAMQTEFNTLAAEINTIVNDTASGGNKLLSAEGQTISVSTGDNSLIQIYAKDLSINATGLTLSANPGSTVLFAVETAIEETTAYRNYLAGRAADLEEVVAANALNISVDANSNSTVDTILDMMTAADIVNQVIEQSSLLTKLQADVTPETALELLTGSSSSTQQSYYSDYFWLPTTDSFGKILTGLQDT